MGPHTTFEQGEALKAAQREGQTQAITNFLQPNATGQLIGVLPQPSQQGPGIESFQTGNPLTDRMLQDYSGNIGMAEQNPAVMENARNAFTQAQQNPEIAPILQGSYFDAIRRRLGLQ